MDLIYFDEAGRGHAVSHILPSWSFYTARNTVQHFCQFSVSDVI